MSFSQGKTRCTGDGLYVKYVSFMSFNERHDIVLSPWDDSPKFSPPQMSMAVSYLPRWLNQDLSITKSPPAIMGVLSERQQKKDRGRIFFKTTNDSSKDVNLWWDSMKDRNGNKLNINQISHERSCFNFSPISSDLLKKTQASAKLVVFSKMEISCLHTRAHVSNTQMQPDSRRGQSEELEAKKRHQVLSVQQSSCKQHSVCLSASALTEWHETLLQAQFVLVYLKECEIVCAAEQTALNNSANKLNETRLIHICVLSVFMRTDLLEMCYIKTFKDD